jgi:hypothetical protein
MRQFLLAIALAVATPTLITHAHASAEKGAKAPDKDEVKYHQDRFNDVQKLSEKLAKEIEKEKDTSDTANALKPHYLDELSALRAQGVETKVEEPLPKHPQHLDNYTEAPAEDREKLVALRDLVVELKGMSPDDKPKVYQKKLGEYIQVLSDRYERKQKRYDNAQ